MDPSERMLLENVLKVSALFEDIVKQAQMPLSLSLALICLLYRPFQSLLAQSWRGFLGHEARRGIKTS